MTKTQRTRRTEPLRRPGSNLFYAAAAVGITLLSSPGTSSAQAPPRGEIVGAAPVGERPWQNVPYPQSRVITGIEFDVATRQTHAQGSDIWPITWADDGHQYAPFGDGAGFNVESPREANGPDRVSLGVARIEGDADGYRGVNVWGGKQAENPATFEGKGTGIISVGGVLSMWVAGPGSLCVPETQLAVSTDHARTWQKAGWKWTMQDRLYAGAFLNFGRDNEHARDEYVYAYFPRLADVPAEPRNWRHEVPGRVDLARVPRERIVDQSAYEWWSGAAANGDPVWMSDLSRRQPVFEDPNGIKLVSVCYHPRLKRYLLLYNPKDNRGHFAFFEAPEPWGPWATVAYLRDQQLFLPPEPNQRVSVFHFAPKWWSDDGRELTLVFNTGDDAWNTVRGRLQTP